MMLLLDGSIRISFLVSVETKILFHEILEQGKPFDRLLFDDLIIYYNSFSTVTEYFLFLMAKFFNAYHEIKKLEV